MLSSHSGGKDSNFLVAVRCRCLHAQEEAAALRRYAQGSDGCYYCVFLNSTSLSLLSSTDNTYTSKGEGTHASVVLVDPDACGDVTSLWKNCVASPRGPSLLLRLEAQGLQRVLSNLDGVRTFAFDEVFPPAATNEDIYTSLVQPLVVAAENGYNGTFFAYGQTGSGKSYTVFGEKGDGVAGLCSLVTADFFGLLTRSPSYHSAQSFASDSDKSLRQKGDNLMIFVSFLELYNERLRDLLVNPATTLSTGSALGSTEGTKRKHLISVRYDDLDVMDHPVHGVFVPHLTSVRVRRVEELESLLEEGSRRRTKAPTNGNEVSSRSHAIVQFTLRRCVDDDTNKGNVSFVRHSIGDPGEIKTLRSFLTAKLSIVDLAGSERVTGLESIISTSSTSVNAPHDICAMRRYRDNRRREGSNINRSLLALGKCIKALGAACRQQKQQLWVHSALGISTSSSTQQGSIHSINSTILPEVHVPYRDSKLTRLLKESLGGNTHTVMLATISPSCTSYEETLSTLRYAARARMITRRVCQNIVLGEAEDTEKEEVTMAVNESQHGTLHSYHQELGGDYGANRRLEFLQLEAEVRSLQTQLHMTQAVTEKMGLSRVAEEWNGVTYADTAAPGVVLARESSSSNEVDRCWAIYDQTRHELQALLRERAAKGIKRREGTEGGHSMRNKELIRELVRQERQNALLNEQQRRIDAFLL